jgi:hypothetical protein
LYKFLFSLETHHVLCLLLTFHTPSYPPTVPHVPSFPRRRGEVVEIAALLFFSKDMSHT